MSADSSTPPYLTSCEQGVYLDLYIRPSASRSKIVGEHDGRLKVQVAAPPVDGKANEVLVKFLAKHLGVARTSIQIVSGETNKRKRLLIEGALLEAVAASL